MMSDNYRSGFLVRIKKTNGKVNNVWLEISTHNDRLETTMGELGKLAKELNLEDQIAMNIKPSPQASPYSYAPNYQPEEVEKKLNVRYFCGKCSYSFPCFPNSPKVMSYYCPTCGRWTNFEKR